MQNLHILLFALIGAALSGCGVFSLFLKENNLSRYESLPRSRFLGMLFGVPALLWCVPHTEVIIFDSVVPYLYPAAIVLAVLCFFYLDYLFARAFGGALIICAYYTVHAAFEFHAPLAVALTLDAWLLGIAGIVFSGKPSWFRDVFRKSASVKYFRWSVAAFCLISAGIYFADVLWELAK